MTLAQATSGEASIIPIIPSVLWFLFAVGMVALFWKKVRLILDALAARIQAGAPFAVGPLNFGAPPPGLGLTGGKSATAEGLSGSETEPDVQLRLLDRRYPSEITDELYLVHTSEVVQPYRGPRTGVWRVRAYVEAYEDDDLLDDIVRITYRLHDTFHQKVIATEARENAFEVWLNIYGEFNLIAYVERRGKPPLFLTRYLDLPGRPTN